DSRIRAEVPEAGRIIPQEGVHREAALRRRDETNPAADGGRLPVYPHADAIPSRARGQLGREGLRRGARNRRRWRPPLPASRSSLESTRSSSASRLSVILS